LPNSLELLSAHRPALDIRHFVRADAPTRLRWRPSAAWAAVTAAAFAFSLYSLLVDGYEDFVYRFF